MERVCHPRGMCRPPVPPRQPAKRASAHMHTSHRPPASSPPLPPPSVQVNKLDWIIWMASFLGTLFISIEIGLAISIGLALLVVIYESAFPHTALLGRISGSGVYRNVKQYPLVRSYRGPGLGRGGGDAERKQYITHAQLTHVARLEPRQVSWSRQVAGCGRTGPRWPPPSCSPTLTGRRWPAVCLLARARSRPRPRPSPAHRRRRPPRASWCAASTRPSTLPTSSLCATACASTRHASGSGPSRRVRRPARERGHRFTPFPAPFAMHAGAALGPAGQRNPASCLRLLCVGCRKHMHNSLQGGKQKPPCSTAHGGRLPRNPPPRLWGGTAAHVASAAPRR